MHSTNILSNKHISSTFSPCKSRSIPKGDNLSLPTRKRRALSWGNMSSGTPWDMTVCLSQLTKDMTDVPIIDIETWVRRSVEERQQETEQKGKILRPMNSFMLYRWAYTERTKLCSRRRSPQVVSSVAGKSWHTEPQNVRDQYRRLAQIERDGHASAYRDYKLNLNLRQRPSVAEPVVHFDSSDLSEHNNFGQSPVQGFGMSIQSPISYPCVGFRPEISPENFVAPIGYFPPGVCFSGLVELPHESDYDLLCSESISPLTGIFIDDSYVDSQWQEHLWHV